MKGVRVEKFNHCSQKIIFKEEFDASHKIMQILEVTDVRVALTISGLPGLINIVFTGVERTFSIKQQRKGTKSKEDAFITCLSF